MLIISYRLIDQVGRFFANGPRDQGSIPGRVIPKTLKIVLDTFLLNTQHYKVRIKGKAKQSRERSSLPHTYTHLGVVAIIKGAFWSPSTTVANFTYFIIKKDSLSLCLSLYLTPLKQILQISFSLIKVLDMEVFQIKSSETTNMRPILCFPAYFWHFFLAGTTKKSKKRRSLSIWDDTSQNGNLRSSLLRCGTRPNEWGAQWDSNSLV